jgi:hypothetical protein
MLRHWQVIWEFGDLPEIELRETIASDLFSSPAGRSNWERFAGNRLREATGKRQREFFRILNEEYENTMKIPSPQEGAQARASQDSEEFVLPFIGAGLVIAAALFVAIRRIARRGVVNVD